MADSKKTLGKKGMGLRPFMISMVLVMVFALALLTFALTVIGEKNPTSPLFEDKYKLKTYNDSLYNSIGSFNSLSDTVSATMGNSDASPTDYVFLIFRGAFDIPYSMFTFLISIPTIIVSMLFTAFGGNTIIGLLISVIVSALIITSVLLIVKAIRTGDSER